MTSAIVTAQKLRILENGDNSGQGEIYYGFEVNHQSFFDMTRKDPIKAKDGETINLNESRQVDNLSDKNPLIINGYVNERDGLFSSDETSSFQIIYTKKVSFGKGRHSIIFQDGRNFKGYLDIKISLL